MVSSVNLIMCLLHNCESAKRDKAHSLESPSAQSGGAGDADSDSD